MRKQITKEEQKMMSELTDAEIEQAKKAYVRRRLFYQNNKERLQKYYREKQRDWRKKNPELSREINRRAVQKRRALKNKENI